MREFHHLGLPTTEKQEGEVYVADTKVWVTDPETHPQKIEFLRFEPGTSVTGLVHDMPHFAFKTDDLERDMAGENVILGPFDPMENLRVVFIEKDGAVFEFMEFKD